MFCTFSERWRAVTTTSSTPPPADSTVWANAVPNGHVAARHVAPNKAPTKRPPLVPWAGFRNLVITPPLRLERFKGSVPIFRMDLERTILESETERLPQSGDDCPPVNRLERFSMRSRRLLCIATG